MRLAGRLVPIAALVAAGCTTQWYEVNSYPDIARTDLVIRTEPSGALLIFDGRREEKSSPVRLPVEYDHVETLYERQYSDGTRMREGMNPILQVLTFPVWGIASFFHYREELHRHTYGNNVHTILAAKSGYEEAEETVTLEGEAEHPVTLQLTPVPKPAPAPAPVKPK